MKNHFLASLILLLFTPFAQAELLINDIAFHVTPMARRMVLHPVAGECDFSRYGYLELGFRVRGAKAVPVRVALRDNTRRINDPESRSLQQLSSAGADPVPMRIYFAGNADFGYVINPARLGRILIETDTPEQFRQLELVYAKLGGKPGEPPPGVRFNAAPAQGMLHPSRLPLKFSGNVPYRRNGSALELDFPATGGLFVLQRREQRWDLSGFDRVRFQLRNPGNKPVPVTCFVSATTACTRENSVYEEAVIPPRSTSSVEVKFKGRAPWICRIVDADNSTRRSDQENERDGAAKSSGGSPLWNEDVLAIAIAAHAPLQLEKARAISGVVTLPEWSGKRPPVPGEWQQTLNEEFNGNTIDLSTWSSGWSWKVTNPQLLCNYSPRNLIVKDGMLHIRSEKKISYFDDNTPDERYFREYTSGSMTTFDKFSQRYGYFEARLRPTTLHGIWPAFWSMPDHGRGRPNRHRSIHGGMEIDIFEQPGRFGPHRNNIACHWWATPAMKEHRMMGFNRLYTARDREGFITAGILWEPGLIIWYLNGEPVARWESVSVPSAPIYLKLCAQIGGWGGYRVDDDQLPYDFLVDYVKVWQRKDLEALNRNENIPELRRGVPVAAPAGTPLHPGEDPAATAEQLRRWEGAGFAVFLPEGREKGRPAIRIDSPDATASRQLRIPVALEAVRGHAVELEAELKAEKVQRPDAAYLGIKLMLVITGADGKLRYHDLMEGKYGNYDWRSCRVKVEIPPDARRVMLHLGLQNAIGTVLFSNIRLNVVK